jgi:hypothetical protein
VVFLDRKVIYVSYYSSWLLEKRKIGGKMEIGDKSYVVVKVVLMKNLDC